MWATLCYGRLAGYSDNGDQGLDMVYLRHKINYL